MIIQIRGTSGSGKSHLVRHVLEHAKSKLRVREPGRKQPIGYILKPEWMVEGLVAVPGHYETACGGCDTIPNMDKVFSKVEAGILVYSHVLFEGLLASEDVRRTTQLHQWAVEGRLPPRAALRVILLTTPVEQCLDGVRDRRVARGDERPLKEDNTRNRVKVIERACARLEAAGVSVTRTDRDTALSLVKEWMP